MNQSNRFVVWIVLAITVFGCAAGADREHRRRRHQQDDVDKKEIVKPVADAAGMGLAQRTQVLGRAQGMRELAAEIKAGHVKTLWDARLFVNKFDHNTRVTFNADLGAGMSRDFSGNKDDNLPSGSDVVFERYATELESILK